MYLCFSDLFLLFSFSAKVFFTLRGEKKEYQSDTRYRNKKDARQNAAYVALVALNLVKYRLFSHLFNLFNTTIPFDSLKPPMPASEHHRPRL